MAKERGPWALGFEWMFCRHSLDQRNTLTKSFISSFASLILSIVGKQVKSHANWRCSALMA